MKKLFLLGAWMCTTIAGWACTNFLVGKDASVDGSTMISYAADSYSLYGFLRFSPASDYVVGSMRDVYDWDTGRPQCSIPQVHHTYSVVGNMNEYQLSIGETTWGGREALWDTVGIDYGSLIYIALERCTTAREAIQCMTSLVAEYGYASEGESFSIADPNEIWIMDMIGKGPGQKGALWVAVRIPDSCIAAHANQSRIQQIPLPNKKQLLKSKKTGVVDLGDWMYAADVISFAKEKGFYTGEDKNFSYQAAYNPYDFTGLYVCEARVWSFFRQFNDQIDMYKDFALGKTFQQTHGADAGKPMPLWITPNRKISLSDMRCSMRDHYDGTENDITKGLGAGPWGSKLRYGSLLFDLDSISYSYPRPTATQQTGWSFIAQMRSRVDAKAGGILWFGVDDAATNLYVPMYCRILDVPECFKEGNGDMYTFSETSAWWIYNMVANWAYSKYSPMLEDIHQVQQAWEEKFDSQIAAIDAQAARFSEEGSREYLTKYSITQAMQSTEAWKQLGIYLLVKYLDGQQRKEENGEFQRNAYGQPVSPHRYPCPETWLRVIQGEVAHE